MAPQLTKKEIIDEIVRCGKDPSYFLDNYAKIVHQEKGVIPFRTYGFQKDLLKDFHDYRFNIILKARQLGISTIVSGYAAWLMLFHKEKNILVMATKLTTAIEIVDKVKDMVNSVPDWLKIAEVEINNKTSFELTNGSKIRGIPTSKDAGRGQALSLLIIDEAAHVEDMDDLWTGLAPTINTGGRCIALSTPNGVGNWFHKTYVDGEALQNNFHTVSLPWSVHPEHDDAWFYNETKNLSKRKVAQEYQCNFNTSGETVISGEDLAELKKQLKEPQYKSYVDRNYHIWKTFVPEGSYLLSADVARGDGRDYSVFHVLDIKNMEQVAEYQGKIDLDNFSKLLFDVGREYGNCMIVVENNNIGFSVLSKLVDLRYPNLYYSTKGNNEFIDSGAALYSSNSVPGFSTTMKTRPLVIAKLEEYIRSKTLKINSARMLNELDTFLWVNSRPEAQKGYNDDLVMSMAIGCWIRDTVLVNNDRNIEYSKVLLNGIMKSNNYLNTSIQGMQNYEYSQRVQQQQQQYKEFMWVLKG
jgi:hypothetical protein